MEAPLNHQQDDEECIPEQDSLPPPGVYPIFGELGPEALVTELGISRIFGRHQDSIRRAVQRDELPQPMKLLGQPTWTVSAIIKHFEKRLEEAAQEAQETRRRLERLN